MQYNAIIFNGEERRRVIKTKIKNLILIIMILLLSINQYYVYAESGITGQTRDPAIIDDITKEVSYVKSTAVYNGIDFDISLTIKGNDKYKPLDLAIVHDLTYNTDNDTQYYNSLINSIARKLKNDGITGNLYVIPAKNGIVGSGDVVKYVIQSFDTYNKQPYKTILPKYSDNSILQAYNNLLGNNPDDAFIFIGWGDGIIGGLYNTTMSRVNNLVNLTDLRFGAFSLAKDQLSGPSIPMTSLITDPNNIHQIQKQNSVFINEDAIVNDITSKIENRLRVKTVRNGTLNIPINTSNVSYKGNLTVTLNGVTIPSTYNSVTNSITVSGINLGKSDELVVNYKVDLNSGYTSGQFYNTNNAISLSYQNPNSTQINYLIDGTKISKTIEKISIQVEKIWNHDLDPSKTIPVNSVDIELYKNGALSTTKTVSPTTWTTSYIDLIKYENGVLVNYKVKEKGEQNNIIYYEKDGLKYKYLVEYTETDIATGKKVIIKNTLQGILNNLVVENKIVDTTRLNEKNTFELLVLNKLGQYEPYNGEISKILGATQSSISVTNGRFSLSSGEKALIPIDINTKFKIRSLYNNSYDLKANEVFYNGINNDIDKSFNQASNFTEMKETSLSNYTGNNLTIRYDNYNYYDLISVNKLIKGNASNMSEVFDYTFTVTKGTDVYSQGKFKLGHQTSLILSSAYGSNEIQNEKIVVPFGYTLTITESENTYRTATKVNGTLYSNNKTVKYTKTNQDSSNNISISFENSKDLIVPTGIEAKTTPIFILLSISILTLIFTLFIKSKRLKEEV